MTSIDFDVSGIPAAWVMVLYWRCQSRITLGQFDVDVVDDDDDHDHDHDDDDVVDDDVVDDDDDDVDDVVDDDVVDGDDVDDDDDDDDDADAGDYDGEEGQQDQDRLRIWIAGYMPPLDIFCFAKSCVLLRGWGQIVPQAIRKYPHIKRLNGGRI